MKTREKAEHLAVTRTCQENLIQDIESALREEYKRGVEESAAIAQRQSDVYFSNMEGAGGDDFTRYDFAVGVASRISKKIRALLDGRDDERG